MEMTQNELDFIQEALYEKVSKILNNLVANENEFKYIRENKETSGNKKENKKSQVVEEVKGKMQK